MLEEFEDQYENEEISHILQLQKDLNSINFSDYSMSKISKSEFAQHYHLLCKKCNKVPVIKFIKRNKIKYECDCNNNIELSIKEVYNYLDYSEEIEIEAYKLNCESHPEEKYIYYCAECNKNLCNKCVEICIEQHQKKIIAIKLDKDSFKKSNYIYDKIKNISKTNINDDNDYIDIENNNNNIMNYKIKKRY